MALFHSPKIVDDGLVLCLDAANTKSYLGTGTTWFDLSGLSNNTTRFDGITYETINAGVLRFDGSSNPMEQTNFYNPSSLTPVFLGTSPSSTGNWNGDCTYEVWVRPLTLGGSNTGHIVSDGNYNEGKIEFTTTGILCTWGSGVQINYAFTPDISKWYHLVMIHTRENTEYRLRFLVDVTERGNTTTLISGSNANYGPDGRLVIGHLFDGYISNIKIYNRALSINEIQQNFIALRGRYGI